MKYADSVKAGGTTRANNSTSLLINLTKNNLKQLELLPHLIASGGNEKYSVKEVKRQSNRSILTIETRKSKCNSQINGYSCNRWKCSITLGLTLPSGIAPIPINEQCVTETSWMGWLPSTIQETIVQWIKDLKPNLGKRAEYSKIKNKLLEHYNNLRYTTYQRAELIHIAVRNHLATYYNDLREKYKCTDSTNESIDLADDDSVDYVETPPDDEEEGYATPTNDSSETEEAPLTRHPTKPRTNSIVQATGVTLPGISIGTPKR